MAKNIAISAVLNIFRKACMVVFPLATYSYATRVLGTRAIGVHEFAQSIVSYFALVAALGITQYAVRDGASYLEAIRDKARQSAEEGNGKASGYGERTKMDDFASEVFSINMCMTVIAYAMLAIAIVSIPLLNSYAVPLMIASTLIIFTTLSVDWINSLFEDYLFLTIRYVVVSLIALVMLFMLVKGPEDLYWYIFIANFATIANGILNFIYVRRYVKLRFTLKLNLAKHALPIFILFCNNIASVVYLNSDVTILRILTDEESVGLYGVASKIYTMIKELFNAAIFVTIPRFSGYVARALEGDDKDAMAQYRSGLGSLLAPLFAVLMPACVGLYFMAPQVMNIVAGYAFTDGSAALRILAIAMFFAVMACFLAYSVIMPFKLERFFLAATGIAASVNIILNFILIPLIGLNAAAWTTLLAEIMVCVILFVIAMRKINVIKLVAIRDYISVIVGSTLVAVVCMLFGKMFGNASIIYTLSTVVAAGVVYLVVMVVFKNSVVGYVKRILKR